MQLLDLQMRVGPVALRSAGVVGVNTYRAHRHQGHARFMLDRTLAIARERGFQISTLDGVPDLYHRWGYATTMPEFTLSLLTRRAEAARRGHRVRRAGPADWPAIARLYNRATAELSGSRVRDPATWPGPRQGSWWDVLDTVTLIALDARDSLAGYLTLDDADDRVMVTDAQMRHAGAAETLLWAAAREALKRRVERLQFQVHPQIGFGAYLTTHEVVIETTRPVGRRQMAKLLDQDSVLTDLTPLLQARARAAATTAPAVLRIETELGATDVRLKGGRARRVVRMPSARLVQLLFGYLAAAAVARTAGARIPGRDLALLETLFPQRDAYCYWPDRY